MKTIMKCYSLPTILAVLCIVLVTCNAFSPISTTTQIASNSVSTPSSTMLKASPKATLTPETTWRLRFSLNGVSTKNGRKVGDLFNVDVQFSEEDGYEPPQGDVVQIVPKSSEDGVQYLKVTKGRWQLSEDPEDRKDGLWIWGLFKEPLYPFMLLQIETDEYSLPGEEGDAIQPLKMYAQINHKRDKNTGEVELDAATLNIREIESIKADPFGAAKIDIYEEVKCGQLSLRPLIESSAINATL
mmetsp:Transcript_2129/g.3226  ORF Transcript_2129/g.3226 Transcript_2129/m.3226 type:complete len:243 (-) Transcript_2129:97-825(-)